MLGTSLAASVVLGVGVGSSACVTQPEGPPTRSMVVGSPPPAPLAETLPPRPSPSSAWIAGYWHWNGIDYVWVPGHWIEPPSGMSYAPPRYFDQRGMHLYQPGAWQGQKRP